MRDTFSDPPPRAKQPPAPPPLPSGKIPQTIAPEGSVEWEEYAPERTGGPVPLREMHQNYLTHLAGLRRYFGLSQEDLSNEVEVSASTIGSWEHGKSSPTIRQLEKWARSL